MSAQFEPGEMEDPERRRRQMLRAVLLGVAVLVLAGGSWWADHSDRGAAADGSAVPEIHADAAPVKEVPRDPGGMVVPDQDSLLLNHDQPKVEELLPPPEPVLPRPTAPTPPAPATVTPAAGPAPTPAAPAPAQSATQTLASAAAATPPIGAPKPASAPPPVAPVTPASIAPPIKKAEAPAKVAAAASGPSYRLQLGALKNEAVARREWLKLQRQHPDVLGRLSLTISPVELGGKGRYYRIQAGPIADAAAALQSCAALKRHNVGCILVKP